MNAKQPLTQSIQVNYSLIALKHPSHSPGNVFQPARKATQCSDSSQRPGEHRSNKLIRKNRSDAAPLQPVIRAVCMAINKVPTGVARGGLPSRCSTDEFFLPSRPTPGRHCTHAGQPSAPAAFPGVGAMLGISHRAKLMVTAPKMQHRVGSAAHQPAPLSHPLSSVSEPTRYATLCKSTHLPLGRNRSSF